MSPQPPTSGLKKGYPGSSIACACGHCARFVSWREKTVVSFFGDIRLSCSYYHCQHCHTGHRPWDEALRLRDRRVTAGAEEAIALTGLLTSFGRAARNTLVKLTGIRVSESTVQRVTEDAGHVNFRNLVFAVDAVLLALLLDGIRAGPHVLNETRQPF